MNISNKLSKRLHTAEFVGECVAFTFCVGFCQATHATREFRRFREAALDLELANPVRRYRKQHLECIEAGTCTTLVTAGI